ncbi:conserved domain protein [Mycoplasmopsis alligatoris A21JP2]|uniref:Conserved domain protein n=2 Tax=Mycoplasmopsis alligatoris TaxID=47687 RepID=D4XVG9_9BACT|nr:conserved domain protein [Mycoplasmopsis alligatoris A21JP2]
MQLSVETVPFKKLQKSVLANLAKINYEIIIGQLFQEEAFSDSEKLIKSQTANITIDPINLKKKEEFDDDFFTTKEVEIKNKSEFVEFIEHDLEENKIGPDIRSAKAVDFKENGNINFSEQNQSNSNKSQPINNSNINKKNNIIKSQYNEKISDEFEFNEIEDTQIVDLNKNKNDSYLSNNSKINEPLNAVPQPNKEIMNDNILNKQIEPEKQTSHKISTKLSKVEEFLDSVFIGQSKEK